MIIDTDKIESQVNYDGESDFEHYRLNYFNDMIRAVKVLDIESLAHGFPGFERQKDEFRLCCKPYYTIRKTVEKQLMYFRDAKTDKVEYTCEADMWEIYKKEDNNGIVILRTGTESELARAYYHMMLALADEIKRRSASGAE